MQKIMFNDKYGLTQAVLEGRKTMTRRIVSEKLLQRAHDYMNSVHGTGIDMHEYLFHHSTYKAFEVVAVAQCLRNMGYDPRDTKYKSGAIWGLDHTPAWTNKMFVSASECIHQIRITGVRVERLQDITDEDCLKEGIYEVPFWEYAWEDNRLTFGTPRETFAALIDKVSGNGAWESNPWVFVYEFELVR